MKKCPNCPETNIEAFANNAHHADGKQTYCRACTKIKQNAWYQKNKDIHIKKVSIVSKKNQFDKYRKSFEYLSKHPCVICGESDIWLLEYDHNQGIKNNNVSNLLADNVSWDRIESEISLCQVLCIRCHRKKTAQEKGVLTYIERYLNEISLSGDKHCGDVQCS